MDTAQAHPFKVEECYLPMKEISRIWPLLAFEKDSGIHRIEIRQNEEQDVLLKFEGAETAIPEIEVTSSISTVHSRANDQVVISGEGYLPISLMDKVFSVSAGSFFQTNFFSAITLVDVVREMTGSSTGTLMDLYCGVGLFSSFLADTFDQIIGIEASESACSDYSENLDAYEHISLYIGAVESVLKEIHTTPDVVIVDPPRKGMNRFAIDALAEKKPAVIIYVSCNPSTLARDIKRLMRSGYVLQRSILVDMFPQTYHIESVNLLTR